jgi:heptosyltransferase-1
MNFAMSEPAAITDFTSESELRSEALTRILIVRLSSMGDILHAMPAVTLLRQALPEGSIGWIIEERWAPLLCAPGTPLSGPRSPGRPLVDVVHTVDTATWRATPFSPETWKEVWAIRRELRAEAYELAIDFQGALRTALMAHWAGAKTLVGFEHPREHAASLLYDRRVEAEGSHVIEQSVSLAAALSCTAAMPPPIALPVDAAAEKWCENALRQHQIHEFAILNPGAGWPGKQWPAEYYGEVAKGLAALGFRSLVNFGPGEESLARAVENSSDDEAEAVPCSLSELISLTRRARLFIGGDTGPMHLAAALRVPVVGIFGPTNPSRSGPFGTRSIVLRSAASSNTETVRRSAARKEREQPDPGLLSITVEDVLGAAMQLLGSALA